MPIGKYIFAFFRLFDIRNFRGTSIEMLKGYMVKESLGTPGLESRPSHRLELLFNLCENKVKTM